MKAQAHDSFAAAGLLALLQLGQRAREAASAAELGFVVVNETRTIFNYRQAALWLSSSRCVAAVSGAAQPDSSAPYLQWLQRLFRERGGNLAQPQRVCAGDLSPTIAEEWGQWAPRHGLLVPLLHSGAGEVGVVLFARDTAWRNDEVELAAEVGRIYGHAAFALEPRQSPWLRVRGSLRSRKVLWRVAALLFVASWVPVRLSTLMPAEVTPRDPYVVRAPLDGVVDRFQVKPNEQVAQDAPLFNLDPTVVASRHAAAQEVYATAQEEYRQSAQLAVMDDAAKLEMAIHRGVRDQRAVELEYSARQLERVQVKAARAGVAVFADVQDWLGRAVAVGEKVLVLADPSEVELTAHLPVGDQIPVAPGAQITFYPQAMPFTSYTATVDSVAYHAEVTDDVLAYRIRAHFDAAQSVPRLGLMGSARVYARRAPLIYLVLRRPLAVARQWFSW